VFVWIDRDALGSRHVKLVVVVVVAAAPSAATTRFRVFWNFALFDRPLYCAFGRISIFSVDQ
jgi:hypothetical protein